ncbi:MAG: hypothetical protein EXQ94_12755 [Alphaproteobacteria bacterium]|nr:hypothetical protein [Alphaproteobacteria bacterium]
MARKGAARPAMSPQMVHDDGMLDEASYAPIERSGGDQGATEAILASLITRPVMRPVLGDTEPAASLLALMPEPKAPVAVAALPAEPAPTVEPAQSDRDIITAWTRKVAKVRRLAANLHPRGLNRDQAAQYVGLSISTFNRLVAEGILPAPLHFGRRRVWDRRLLDTVLDALSGVTKSATNDA